MYGFAGTYPETYANENSIKFSAIGLSLTIGEKTDGANARFVVHNGKQTLLEEADGNTTYSYNGTAGTYYDLVTIVEKTSADSPTIVKSQYFYIDVLSRKSTALTNLNTYTQIYDNTTVRVGKPTGLRFKANITSLAKDETASFEITEYGFIIAKKSDLGEKELSFEGGLTRYVYAPAYVKETGTDIIFNSSNDDYDVFTGVLYNIPEKQYKTELACRTYTKIKIGENTFTLYGETMYGSLYGAAQSALATATDSAMREALANIIAVADKTPMIDVGDLMN